MYKQMKGFTLTEAVFCFHAVHWMRMV